MEKVAWKHVASVVSDPLRPMNCSQTGSSGEGSIEAYTLSNVK